MLFGGKHVELVLENFLFFKDSSLMGALLGLEVQSELFQVIFKFVEMISHLLLLTCLLIYFLHVLVSLFLNVLQNRGILLFSNV